MFLLCYFYINIMLFYIMLLLLCYVILYYVIFTLILNHFFQLNCELLCYKKSTVNMDII